MVTFRSLSVLTLLNADGDRRDNARALEVEEENATVFMVCNAPAGVSCHMAGIVESVNDQIALTHKSERHEALMSFSLNNVRAISYVGWDRVPELVAMVPRALKSMFERPIVGIMFPGETIPHPLSKDHRPRK